MLKKNDSYEIFSVQAGKVLMVTVRDLLNAKNLSTSRFSTIAAVVPKLSPDDRLGSVVRILSEYRIRALPVVQKGKVEGALKIRDIVKMMQDSMSSSVKVSAIMTPNPITIDSGDTALKAKNLMLRRKIDHLPIMRNGKLAGIVDSDSILYAIRSPERQPVAWGSSTFEMKRTLNFPVDEIMSGHALEVAPNDSLQKLIAEMLKAGTNAALVTWAHELQGIVTFRDVVKILAEKSKQEPQVYIVGLPDDPFESETAKTKFSRIVATLSKSMRIIEARAKIKMQKTSKDRERRRYQVMVSIATVNNIYNFSREGFQLSDIFDQLQQSIKRINVKRPKTKPTARKMSETE
ncbi:MAG: CBS domain-containing protein [Thaumarchaeota archaeon]|nr:CBS domain-containing protein [Nitrososphaerota archaeon]